MKMPLKTAKKKSAPKNLTAPFSAQETGKQDAESSRTMPASSIIKSGKLVELNTMDAAHKLDAALAGKKHHFPLTLQKGWEREHSKYLMDDFRANIRDLVNKNPKLDDPEEAPLYLATLFQWMTYRFGALVDSGEFDEALPTLHALPVLYSPSSGKGASGWVQAREVFDGKRGGNKVRGKVGSKATGAYVGFPSGGEKRTQVWRRLAEMVVRVIQEVKDEMPGLRKKAEEAASYKIHDIGRHSAQSKPNAKRVVRTYFFLEDGFTFCWHSWMDHLDKLPSIVRAGGDAFIEVVRMVVDDFFAAPKNERADEIINPMIGSGTRADAEAQAKWNIIEAVKRL